MFVIQAEANVDGAANAFLKLGLRIAVVLKTALEAQPVLIRESVRLDHQFVDPDHSGWICGFFLLRK